jgi:hypothetical protein
MTLLRRPPVAGLVFVCLAFFNIAAFAQSCPPPPAIALVNGSNPTCGGQPVTLDAGAGWASYLWSNGAPTQTITVSPTETTSYSVTVTDGNSCTLTSAPYSVTVGAASPTPVLHSNKESVCAYGLGRVTLDPPAGAPAWASIQWSADHAILTTYFNPDGSTQPEVGFTGDGSGEAIVVHAHVVDANGCPADGSITIPIRTISAPVIHPAVAAVCAYGHTTATIDPPSDAPEWSSVDWSAEHAYLTISYSYPSYRQLPTVGVTADGSGEPIVIHARVSDSNYCSSEATATINIRTISAPAIHPAVAAVCAYGHTTATIDPPSDAPEWSSIDWSAEHAYLTISYSYPSYRQLPTVGVTADGSGLPIVIHARVSDSNYCSSEATATINIRSIEPPAIRPAAATVCDTGSSTATIDPPTDAPAWSYIDWSAEHAYLSISYVNGRPSPTVGFTTDGSGQAVVLHARVSDSNYCSAESSLTIPVTTLATPSITVDAPAMCSTGVNHAVTDDPPAGDISWGALTWWAEHGIINGPTSWTNVSFSADGSGLPVVLHVRVRDLRGCERENSATINIQNVAPPAVHLAASDICPLGSNSASIDGSMTGMPWNDAVWSIEHGTITAGGYGTAVTFSADGSGMPVVLHLHTRDNGQCQSDQTVTVPIRTLAAPVITASGPTTFCAGGSVTLTAPYGYSYQWSNGASTQSITVAAEGSYSVTVSAGGCSATSAPTSVSVNALPSPVITPYQLYTSLATATDAGDSYGGSVNGNVYTYCGVQQIGLRATGGVSYLWSTGATTPSINVSQSGSYTVTATGANGCSASATVVVNFVQPQAVVTASGTSLCPSGGSVSLTANQADSYSWSSGESTRSITVTQPGSYSVTTTISGCSTTSQPVNIGTTAPAINASGPLCPGGSVTLTASSATSWSWSTGATSQSISVTQSGDYSVTVVDGSGCTSSATTTVATPVSVTVSAPADACSNAPVTVTSTAANGAAPYSYQWLVNGSAEPGATAATYTATPSYYGPTTFAVRVRDANGCIVTSSDAVVNVHYAYAPVISSSAPLCAGTRSTANVYYAPPGATYQWTITGGTIVNTYGSFVDFVAGNSGNVILSAVVSDPNGCSSNPTLTIPVDPSVPPTITAGGATTFCEGGSVTLTANGGYANVQWSNGATGASITVAGGGSYTVSATGPNGCSLVSDPMVVTVNPAPSVSISAIDPNPSCGQPVRLGAFLSYGGYGVDPTSWTWSNGASGQFITVSETGDYIVTVAFANGCSRTSPPIHVSINPPPQATITAEGPTTFCAGGSVRLTANSGPGYTYSWSTRETTQSIVVSLGGTYNVFVTDANGCVTGSSSTRVTVNPHPTATVSGGGTICAGGSATVTATLSGTAPFSVTWSDGVTQSGISGNSVSRSVSPSSFTVYTITALSDANCSGSSSGNGTVNVNPRPTAVVSGSAAICAGTSATIAATLTGTAPFSITWSDGVTTTSGTRTVNPSSTTTYTVTSISDANCSGTSSGSAVVTVKARPTAVVSGSTAICAGTSATITATLSGTAPFSITWSDGVTTTSGSRSVNPSSTTTYTVTSISDANCSGSASGSATVTVKARPSAAVSGNAAICAGTSATITATLTGTAPFSITWSDGVTTTSGTRTVNPSSTTTFTITSISDANCSGTASGSATVTVNPRPTAAVSGNATICAGSSTTITAALTGTAPFSVTWSDGVTTSSGSRTVNPSSTTTYTVTSISDANCAGTSSGSAVVTVNQPPMITAQPSVTPSSPNHGQNFTLSVTAAGTPTLTYQWYNAATNAAISGATSRTYTASQAKKGTYSYYVIVKNPCNNTTGVKSNTINVVVN